MSVDLSTRYLGLELPTPLVVAASPLSHEIASIRELAAAGAGAVVLYSLFEEQVREQEYRSRWEASGGAETPEREIRYAPPPRSFATDPDSYVRHLEKALRAVKVPVIPSLNAVSPGGWTDYARRLEDAGAPALEINLYYMPASLDESAAFLEEHLLDTFSAVRGAVEVPLAVKLGPYYTNVAHVATELVAAGADGLVLFNRFYQPDLDLETGSMVPQPLLSGPEALRLPLRWIALLAGRVDADLAASGGILAGGDALKAIAAGADVAMLCSTLLRHGSTQIGRMRREMERWLEEHGHPSADALRDTMSQETVPDSEAFERSQYIRAIHGVPK